MAKGDVTRRLAAIVAADVAGYSRLIAADEEGTFAAFRTHRLELLEPKIAEYCGRIANTAGDSLLIEFPSIVQALRCAVDLQQAMIARNADIAEDRRVTFRVGIHVGDVIEQDGDLLGDGVNVAARLEGLADPGGVCLSEDAHRQVRDRVEVGFEDLGLQELKNIPEQVRVYRVLLEGAVGKTWTTPRRRTSPIGPTWAALALVVIAATVAGGLWWWQPWVGWVKPADPAKMAFPLPEKPSIAVLPFNNIGADPEQEYFADGMTEDIITDLSKISGLFVIARNSTFAYKGASLNIRKAAEELGVRYVLEGTVRRVGQQVRINAQLIDAATGGHLWADRYDGRLDDIFSLQDELTTKIVTVLAVQLTTSEQEQFARRQTENVEAYDVFLKGWDHYLRQTPKSFRNAIAHFEKAVELDANYSRAYAALSATYWQVYKRYWHERFGFGFLHDARFKAEELLAKAGGHSTALSHQVAAAILSQQGRHTEAIAEGGKAIGVDPNDADSYVALAGALSLAGNPGEALKLLQQAMRLNPHFPAYYLYELGLAQFGLGDFQKAAATLEKATKLNPEDRWSLRLLLATYGHLGRNADAERLLEIAEKNWRGYDPISIRAVAFWYPFEEAADQERLAMGLRKANVPD